MMKMIFALISIATFGFFAWLFDDGDVKHGYTRALQDIIDKINSL